MRIICSLLTILCLSNCAISPKIEPLAKPTAVLLIREIGSKNPKDIKKFNILINKLSNLSETLSHELTLGDFLKITSEIDADPVWALIGETLYSYYKEEFKKTQDKIESVKSVVKYIQEVMYIAFPSK